MDIGYRFFTCQNWMTEVFNQMLLPIEAEFQPLWKYSSLASKPVQQLILDQYIVHLSIGSYESHI